MIFIKVKQLNDIRNQIGNKYYKLIGKVKNKFSFRPKQEGDFIPYNVSYNVQSMVEVVNYLAKLLYVSGNVETGNVKDVIMLKRLKEYKIYDKIILYNPDLTIKSRPKKDKSISKHAEMEIDTGIMVRRYHVLYNKLWCDLISMLLIVETIL